MYTFTVNNLKNGRYDRYFTLIDTPDLITALHEYLDRLKEKFQDDLRDKSSLQVAVTNDVVFIDVSDSPMFGIAMSHIDQVDNQSLEFIKPIDLSDHIDYIKDLLIYSYKYTYAFITASGEFITGDCKSATRMTHAEIAEQAFNTEHVHTYGYLCDCRTCGGYVRLENGHTEDFNGIYKEEELS